MSITLESLGFTKEELQERVIERLCAQVMSGHTYDEDGAEVMQDSQFARKLNEAVRKQIDDTINALAATHVLPNVHAYIENLTLQQTNKWGEKQAQPITFIEYLTQRAEAYINEKVSYDGKGKDEANGYSWSGTQTRITFLVNKHLHYSIETAMKDALKIANSAIATGIEETVKRKLAEVVASLKTAVTVGR